MDDQVNPLDRAAAVDEVERQLARLVRRVRARWRSLAQQIHPQLQPLGYLMLALLTSGGPAPTSRLVAALGTDKSTVSRQVAQLERLGLIERRVDEADRRVRLLAVRPATAERVARLQELSLADLRSELGSWPLDDVVSLGAGLARLGNALLPDGAAAEPADGGAPS